jgi:hypothetical protein
MCVCVWVSGWEPTFRMYIPSQSSDQNITRYYNPEDQSRHSDYCDKLKSDSKNLFHLNLGVEPTPKRCGLKTPRRRITLKINKRVLWHHCQKHSINLAPYRPALVSAITNLGVSWKEWNFLASWRTIILSRSTPLYGFSSHIPTVLCQGRGLLDGVLTNRFHFYFT